MLYLFVQAGHGGLLQLSVGELEVKTRGAFAAITKLCCQARWKLCDASRVLCQFTTMHQSFNRRSGSDVLPLVLESTVVILMFNLNLYRLHERPRANRETLLVLTYSSIVSNIASL